MKKELTYPQKAIKIYRALYRLSLGEDVVPQYAKWLKILNKLSESYAGVRLLAIVFVHFEWRGVDGKDERAMDGLRNSGFPIEWLSSKAPMYASFLKGVLGEDVWNNDDKLRAHVADWISDLKKSLGKK